MSGIDRIAPTRRPAGRPIGFQSWRDLAFLHWRVPPAAIARLLPDSLTVDTFDGDAWVGLVPFSMERVRPWWGPPVPGISWFLETNVRTYVHRDGRDPGVWFFSLDADARIAVAVARLRWNLNYRLARMTIERSGDRIRYFGRRRDARAPDGSDVALTRDGAIAPAAPGTLEHFLVERYLLYTVDRGGRLLRGQVHHEPYAIGSTSGLRCEESLLAANGIDVDGPPVHAVHSPGVDVEIHPLGPVDG